MLYVPSTEPIPAPEGLPSTDVYYYETEYITKDYEYVKAVYEQQEATMLTAISATGNRIGAFVDCYPTLSEYGDQILKINVTNLQFLFFPNGKVYLLDNGGGR